MITHVAIRRGAATFSLPAPNRHHHVLRAMYEAGADPKGEDGEVQGFLDDAGAFLTREEAYRAVVGTPELKRRAGGYDGPLLFSEDLW